MIKFPEAPEQYFERGCTGAVRGCTSLMAAYLVTAPLILQWPRLPFPVG